MNLRTVALFAGLALMFILTGQLQSWNLSLSILNTALLAAIMAMGVNMQWGFAGLFNTGIMGFVALGGLAVVLVSSEPVPDAWRAGGPGVLAALILGVSIISLSIIAYKKLPAGRKRTWAMIVILGGGFFLFRAAFDGPVALVESVNPATSGNLGGLGLPTLVAWPAGGLLAAVVAWAIAKTALGLRSDYLAIATLGIAEIIISVMKNEDWLARGVKNVISLPRPVPYEVDFQADPLFLTWADRLGFDPVIGSSIIVKLCYAGLFVAVLTVVIFLSERALNSPWGRMIRAIRDNEVSASAMGKNVTGRHLQIFVIGSAVVGVAGAMMTTMDGQLTPGTYNPLRYTFLVWVMVIVGGSGNNWGALLGGLLIGWLWLIVESLGPNIMMALTGQMMDGPLKDHLQDAAAHTRLLTLGVILLLVLRFSPKGLIPEK